MGMYCGASVKVRRKRHRTRREGPDDVFEQRTRGVVVTVTVVVRLPSARLVVQNSWQRAPLLLHSIVECCARGVVWEFGSLNLTRKYATVE
jgi:hypothetical protein